MALVDSAILLGLFKEKMMNMKRTIVYVNGVEREVLFDADRDSLADCIRRLGLTGTKVGCGTGQCGACSLLLDGKVVRSCVRKMDSVPSHARIETIEGLGQPGRLHPLQQAFLTYAGVQCGFCSPGFIMSARGLLLENPSPTRQEVRDWFTRHNNICRCTGYKPIVDAVMAASAVMRGEKSMEDITFTPPRDGRIYGTDFPKPTGMTRVLGTCDFGADIAEKCPAGTLHLAVVLARVHHARLEGLDLAEAEAMPGVVRVLTARDVKGSNRFFAPQGTPHSLNKGHERPVICDDKIRRWGDIVAVVAAATRQQARDAAARVKVRYRELPPALTFEEAVAPGAERVYDDVPNVYMEQPLYKGADPRPLLADAAFVVEGSFSTTREPHLPIEPDVIQAYPEGEDGVVIQCKSQFLYGIIGQMADAIGVAKDRIRIIGNPAGGSFGYSMSPCNYGVAAACALALNAPVSLVMSYEEHQHTTGKRSPIQGNARMACDACGKLVAGDFLIGLDHGAYSEMAGNLTTKVVRFFGVPYNMPNIRGLVRTAFTNGNFGTAYRAFGSPQAYTISESLIDMLARKAGIDPFEFRYNNIAQEGESCPTSVPYRVYSMREMMDRARPAYQKAVADAKRESTPELRRGVGVAWGGYHVSKCPDHAEVDLELNADGSVTCYNTWADVGQGADLGTFVHVHEALRPLQLTPGQIHLVHNDTATCPDTGPASGSRSHHVAGLAIIDAARKLMDAMRKDDGTFRTWQEMKDAGLETRYRGIYESAWKDIDPDNGHGWGSIQQNFVLYIVEVAVEPATGKTRVLKAHIVADVGRVGSYHGVLGQAWGGFSHSLGYALSERYDDMKRHAGPLGAGVPKCNDVPDIMEVDFVETPRDNGPNGSTGCAEGFQSSGHVAILNAICDAVGVRITSLPATPEKVKAALNGTPDVPNPWDLGCELYAQLEKIAQSYPPDKPE